MKNFFKHLLGYFFLAGTIVYTGMLLFMKEFQGELLPVAIFMIFLFAFLSYLCLRKTKANNKMQTKSLVKTSQPLDQEKPSLQATFRHVNGLPIAENLFCTILSYSDRLEFKSGTTEIKLARSKITDMCTKSDVEIQKHMVSNAGGAIAGGIMFGPLGALIGGRAKSKSTKHITNYLIITYITDQRDVAYIGFDVTDNLFSAGKFIKEFKNSNTTDGIKLKL